MDILLIVLAFLCVALAIVGSIVPAIPGLPLAYLSLWLAEWSGLLEFSAAFLWIMAGVTLLVFLADYFLPPLVTKRFGGSKYATWGSVIGMVAGMIFTPIGMVFGMLLGAFLGEVIGARRETGPAIQAAFGAFLGFLLGTGMKLLLCGYILYRLIAGLL